MREKSLELKLKGPPNKHLADSTSPASPFRGVTMETGILNSGVPVFVCSTLLTLILQVVVSIFMVYGGTPSFVAA